MSRQEAGSWFAKMGRRDFIKSVTAAGVGLVITGIVPHPLPAADQPKSEMPHEIRFGGEVRMGERVPVVARCSMLEVRELDFAVTNGLVAIDVLFHFIDGRLDGGAAFRMKLFSPGGKLVADQVDTEMRNRKLPAEFVGPAGKVGGDDAPNRVGKAKLRFPTVTPGVASEFFLEISPVD